VLGVRRRAAADEDQLRASRLDLTLVRAELRGLLRAEESTKVAEEDEHRGLVLEERSDLDHLAVEAEDGGGGKLRCGGLDGDGMGREVLHGHPMPAPRRRFEQKNVEEAGLSPQGAPPPRPPT